MTCSPDSFVTGLAIIGLFTVGVWFIRLILYAERRALEKIKRS